MNTKHNAPAFPAVDYVDERPVGMAEGMTKREYFASQALQGLITNGVGLKTFSHDDADAAAKMAVIVADKLIEELNQTEHNPYSEYGEY